MKRNSIDDKIIELMKNNENISIPELSTMLGIPEKEVEGRIRSFSDTRQKILIADDEIDTLLPLKRSLEAMDYIVVEASSGPEAIKRSHTERPELVILDVMMPGMDGIEVCKALKKDARTGNIPVIMLTARDEVKDIVESLEIGADDYVTKPFNLNELKARIRSVLRRAGTL